MNLQLQWTDNMSKLPVWKTTENKGQQRECELDLKVSLRLCRKPCLKKMTSYKAEQQQQQSENDSNEGNSKVCTYGKAITAEIVFH